MSVNQSLTSNNLAAEKQERAKLGMLVFVALLFAVAITYIYNLQNEEDRYKSDFYPKWYATQKMIQDGRNLYAWENGEEVLELRNFPGAIVEQGLFFYPAFLLVFTLPLSFLPYTVANLIWSILIQIFLIAGLVIFQRLTDWPSSVNKFSLFLFVAIVLWPNVLHTSWEQFNSIGLLGWALMSLAVRRGRYGWAGVAAVLLIFKPQHTLFILLFYLFWLLRKPRGQRFYFGFAGTAFALWLFGEIFQSSWVPAFLEGLSIYRQATGGLPSVANEMLGHPLWSAGISLVWLGIIWKQIDVSPNDTRFWALQAFSLGVGLFIVPIGGMWHTIILYPAIILVAAGWRQRISLLQDRSLITYRIMRGLYYLVFIVAFLIGLLFIEGAEPVSSFIWRNMGSVLAMLLALPLCFNWPGIDNAPATPIEESALATQ